MPGRDQPPDVGDALLEESAEDLYEHAPCGYLSTLPGGLIVKVNETFLAWTGHRREDLVGRRRFQDLLTPGGRIYHETHYAPLLHMQGAVREIAVEVVRADGRRLPMLVNSVLRRDADGAPLLVRTTAFDATDRKRYERELLAARDRERAARERNERLQRVTAALAAALDQPQIAEATVSELVAATGAASATLAVADEDGGALHVVLEHGPSLDVPAAPPREPRFDEDPGFVALPLEVGGHSRGVLCLGFAARRAFAADERALLTACAAQCAQALERARLHERMLEAARRMALLAQASRALDEAPGFDARAQRLVDVVVPSLADEAWLQEPDGNGGPPATIAAAQPAKLSSARAAAAERAIATGEAQLAAADSVALPLRAHGRVLGALTLARHAADPGFGRDDLPFLRELADRAGLALENAHLYEQQRSVAHALQHSLLAGAPPEDPRFAVASHYQPGVRTLEVGGDWHDTFRIADDRIGLVVGDVVGRGIDAATAMGQLRSAIRALAGADAAPARLIEQLDRFVARIDAAQNATVAYADVTLDTGRMRFACAGHPPPLLGPAAGDPRFLWDGRSAPLGAYGSLPADREEAEVMLEPGARVLLYTDGLVERRGRTLDVGLDGLLAAFGRRRDAALATLVGDLPELLLDGLHNDDDVCLLGFEYAGAR